MSVSDLAYRAQDFVQRDHLEVGDTLVALPIVNMRRQCYKAIRAGGM